MAKNAYSGFERRRVVAKAYEVTVVDFFDTTPNYFRVTNHGAGRLYFSANRNPTLVNYDFVCDGDNVKLYTEPHGRDRLYIFNPTGSDCAVEVMSFYAEFDPIALAFTALSLDFSGTTIETSTAITSFNSALPQGNNKIGSVAISGALPAGENKIGKVTVDNPPADYNNMLTNIITVMGEVSRGYMYSQEGTLDDNGYTYPVDDGRYIDEIAFLSNDSDDTDIYLTCYDANDGQTMSIHVKPNEVINNCKCGWSKVKVTGDGASFRLICVEKAVI